MRYLVQVQQKNKLKIKTFIFCAKPLFAGLNNSLHHAVTAAQP